MQLGGWFRRGDGNVGGEGVTKKPTREGLILGGLAAGLLVGTCVIPYRFPPKDFVVGASFEVGFNNAISYLSYVAFIPFLALVAARLLASPGHELPATLSWKSSRFSRWVGAVVILAHVVLFTVLYAYKGRFVFAEGLYFQSLLYRMTQGDIPYVDFSFYYGPLMLYPGYWLSRWLGLDAGYGVWFVTTYIVGLLFLYTLLCFCAANARAAALWFVFLAFGLFNPLTGLNITFTRYLFPSIVFLTVATFLQRGGWRRALVASVSLATAVIYSFEVAALSVGATLLLCLAYAVNHGTWTTWVGQVQQIVFDRRLQQHSQAEPARPAAAQVLSRTILLLVTAGTICAASFLLIDPSGAALRSYPGIAQSYSGGAHNVPIYPHLPFLALTTVTVAALAAVIWIASQSPDVLAAGALAYATVALVAQRAAFGAAEPSHFAYFGLPIFLIGVFVATRAGQQRAAQAVLAAVLLVGIMLPMQYYHLTEFLPFVAQRIHLSASVAAAPAEVPESGATLEQSLRDVVDALGSNHPYVMYEMEYSSLPVYRDFRLRYPMYSTMLITARDAAGIREAIDEVLASRAIVIIRKQDLHELDRPRRSTGLWRVLDLFSGAHTGGSELNALLLQSKTRLMSPFLEFVQTEYLPLYDRQGLLAFGPKPQ